MKNILASLLVLALAMAGAGCAAEQAPGEPSGDPAPNGQAEAVSLPAPAESADPAVVDGVNGMGVEMLKRLYPVMGGENFMISPVSISLALSMTMNGAKTETLAQMQEALHFTGMEMDAINAGQKDLMSILLNPDNSEKVQVEIANALWAERASLCSNRSGTACRDYYGADTRLLDFDDPQARGIINAWVDEQTHGMIPAIVEGPIPSETVLFLINTLYFDGKWSMPFDPERTYDGTFTQGNGEAMTVPMMSANEDLPVYSIPDADCFGKSFGENGRLEMVCIRPEGGLDSFLKGFSVEQLARITAKGHTADILINIPRFSYDTSLDLNEVLIGMGMENAFDEGRADLSGMGRLGRGNPYISKVVHKTRIEVKEEGAKAAAVTSVEVDTRAAEEPTVISLDSPFLYLIRDTQTGAVLFIGVVEEPVEE